MQRVFVGKILAPYKEKNGYLYVRPRPAPVNRKESVHALVAQAFIGDRPPGHDVHHLDGDKTNNRPHNLAYVLERKHAKSHGKEASATFYRAKLTEDDVREIRRLVSEGVTQTAVAKLKGITQAYVSDIVTGRAKCWQHIR